MDDQWHSHPKAVAAGLGAMGLWSAAGSFSVAFKTDGWVPRWYVAKWPSGSKFARRLVVAGLWVESEQDGQPGWLFHDWTDYQPTARQIEAQRKASRLRQQRHRNRGDEPPPDVTP